VINRRVLIASRTLAALVLLGGSLFSRPATAEVVLVEKDGWSVFITGRVQAFLNYNKGDGYPKPAVVDGNGGAVTFLGGGLDPADSYHEFVAPRSLTDTGKIEEMRLRTGFVGNVLGFGIRKKLNENTDVFGFTAVTTYIDSTERRKYREVRPDWRESFLKITGPWGSLAAGRMLGLYSAGATEITYLYGFKYGLGWVGSVSNRGGSGPGAGHVGFGVLANGFAGGVAYATPSLSGLQATVGVYDANTLVGSGTWERVRWPRAETELTFEQKLGGAGMVKVFANGAWQKIYSTESPAGGTILGAGFGGRAEFGPVHLGLAGHYGKGVGMDYALQPTPATWDGRQEYNDNLLLRKFYGYYAQAMLSPLESLDIHAGFGATAVVQNPEDKVDSKDDDGTLDMPNPATPAANDDANPAVADSVGFVTIKQQMGISGGVTIHATPNIHIALEYFRAAFEWYKPIPTVTGSKNPSQNINVINAGITYDF